MPPRSPEPDCPFCRLPPEAVTITTGDAIAFLDRYPLNPGHTLVVPGRHVASIFDLPAAELAALWELVGIVQDHLAKLHRPDGFNVGVNDGAAAGQTVGHAHVHVIPRWRGDVPDPRGGVRWVVPQRAAYWTDPA